MGCRVISQASSGVWQILKKSLTTRISLNSGKYLPAWFQDIDITKTNSHVGVVTFRWMEFKKTCLITQTGALSTFSPLAAFSNLSLSSFGKFSAVKEVISEGCNSTVGVLYMCWLGHLFNQWVLIILQSSNMWYHRVDVLRHKQA